MNLVNFKINKNLSAISQTKFIKKYIDRTANKKISTTQIIFLSRILQIPKDIIKFEFKKYLSLSYNFKLRKFNNNKYQIQILKLKWLIVSSVSYYANLLVFILFSKNIYFKKKIKLIYDEVFTEHELNRAEVFLKKIKSHKIISKVKSKKNSNIFDFPQFFGCSRQYLYKNFFNFFIIIPYFVFKTSLKDKINYFPFYNYAIKKTIRYETVFKKYRANVLIQERPYTTSAIKNYLFKKYGGKKTCCFQRILFHIGNTSFYINTDILFSLGKMSAKTLEITGTKIGKIVPLGSFMYYSKWIKSKKIKTKKYDIIFLGGNNVPSMAINEKYLKNYYLQLNWLRKISLENPKLKILMKHHLNNKYHDPKELKILEGTNIERITSNTLSDKFNNSYGYAINSKLRLSWCSTMGYELLGHNYQCFFLDPNYENLEFFQNYSFNKKYRIKNFFEFKSKINEILVKNIKEKVSNPENYCFNSKDFLSKFIKYSKIN
tara:strand:- start:620 stop:2086 length:1467 start_codon:yes stop_codon:yes gene_type:complete